jgi:glycosyltransferase involved in cell wall biosynthesis
MMISGFTIVRNAVELDFPVVESIRSILPICDEVVVNVGRSTDQTLELVRSIGDPKVRIIETEWDFGRGESVLRDETLRAMRGCRHPWGLYIQADEVLHESGAAALRATIAGAEAAVEGIVVNYRHFFGDPATEAVNRRWYRREVRGVRLDPALAIHPFRDAQGFRVGPTDRRVIAKLSGAEMYHYGWIRSAAALRGRAVVDRSLYPSRPDFSGDRAVLGWFPGLRPFRGSHPAVAQAWVERHRDDPERRVAEPRFHWEHLRFYASDLLERLTGKRWFEFRNYELV